MPTALSFFNYPEGNKIRLLSIGMLAILFFLNIKSIHNHNFRFTIKNPFLPFLFITCVLSLMHVLIEKKSTPINYVDFFAPCCLLIYGMRHNIEEKTFIKLLCFWFLMGVVELILNLTFSNKFCLPHCIYYESRPNSAVTSQGLLGFKESISLESLGLGSQEFTTIIGLLIIYLVSKGKYIQSLTFIPYHLFSISFSCIVAEISTLFYLYLKNVKYYYVFIVPFLALFLSFIVGSSIKLSALDNLEYYLNELLLIPVFFLFSLNFSEILFGVFEQVNLPSENRIFVLIFRFGLIWFLFLLFLIFNFLGSNIKKNLIKKRIFQSFILFIAITSFHNALWQTISGCILFSTLIAAYSVRPKKII